MSPARPGRLSRLAFALRKTLLSAFVVFGFTAYALHERAASADSAISPALSLGDAPPSDLSGSAQSGLTLARFPAAAAADSDEMVFMADQPLPTEDAPMLVVTAEVSPTVTPTPTLTPSPTPTATPTATAVPATPLGPYLDGRYDGPVTDALYGPMQVRVIIQNGQIAQMQVLDYPHDRRTSVQINHIALPRLAREIMRAQSAHVDIISGATLSSQAFLESLDAALQQAQIGVSGGQLS